MLYGLENSSNWGWDWFATETEAIQAKASRPKLYGHNDAPWPLTRAEIANQNL